MRSESEFRLTPKQGNVLILRTIIVAALSAFAFGWGLYGVAPGGSYTFYSDEIQSFNPATYSWFFMSPFGSESMVVMGTLIGVFCLVVGVPVGLLIGFALRIVPRLRPIALTWVNLSIWWSLVIPLGWWLIGLAVTLHDGRNPGICC
jgi:ABC-type spermidine/putrescine transport system permease subunit I